MHLLTGKTAPAGQTVVAGVTTGPAIALPPLPHSLIIQTGIPENRTKILLRLKDVARSLTPYAHQLPTGLQGLNEQIPEAYELCNLIEVCLLHGIRIREFHGVVPLWGLLERLDALYMTPPPSIRSNSSTSSSSSGNSKSLVSVVSSLSHLRTPLSKARGWIRLVLNRRSVDEAVQVLLNEPTLLNLFYTTEAMLANSDNVMVLMAVLRSLKVLPFALTVDDPSLNNTPAWLLAVMAATAVGEGPGLGPASGPGLASGSPARTPIGARPPLPPPHPSSVGYPRTPTNTPTPTTPPRNTLSTPSSSSRGGLFGSLMSTLERGLNGVLEKVDAFANKVAMDTPLSGAFAVLEGRRPLTPLFKSHLRDLLLDDRRCSVCHMDPRLGVPTMVLSMIAFLDIHVDTPGLFRQRVPPEAVWIVRRCLEREEGIPTTIGTISNTTYTVHAVAQTLLQWLNDLPEPLLGYNHYHAIHATCLEVEEESHRLRNLTLLIQETPWYNQPLLVKLLALFRTCVQEEHSDSNGLTITTLAVLCTPFFLRPPPSACTSVLPAYLPLPVIPSAPPSFTSTMMDEGNEEDEQGHPRTQSNNDSHASASGVQPVSSSSSSASVAGGSSEEDKEEDWDPSGHRAQIAAAAAGSTVVQFLFRHEGVVVAPVRAHLNTLRQALTRKVSRVRSLVEEVGLGVNLNSMGPRASQSITAPSSSSSGSTSSSDSSLGLGYGSDPDHSSVSVDTPSSTPTSSTPSKVPLVQEDREARLYQLALALWRALGPTQELRRSRLLHGVTAATATGGALANKGMPLRPGREGDGVYVRYGGIAITTTSVVETLPSSSSSSSTVDSNNNDKSKHKQKHKPAPTSSSSTSNSITATTQATPSSNVPPTVTSSGANDMPPPTLLTLLQDGRWSACGFPSMPLTTPTSTPLHPSSLTTQGPLKDFHGNGLLALRCLTAFLERYQDTGASLGAEFAQHRARHCSLAQTAVQLARFTAEVLRIAPTPDTPINTPIQYLAKQCSWPLLSDETCFQQVFNLSLWTYNEAWHAATEARGVLPHAETAQQCLLFTRDTLEALITGKVGIPGPSPNPGVCPSPAPSTMEAVWEAWWGVLQRKKNKTSGSTANTSSSGRNPTTAVTSSSLPTATGTGSGAKSSTETNDSTKLTSTGVPSHAHASVENNHNNNIDKGKDKTSVLIDGKAKTLQDSQEGQGLGIAPGQGLDTGLVKSATPTTLTGTQDKGTTNTTTQPSASSSLAAAGGDTATVIGKDAMKNTHTNDKQQQKDTDSSQGVKIDAKTIPTPASTAPSSSSSVTAAPAPAAASTVASSYSSTSSVKKSMTIREKRALERQQQAEATTTTTSSSSSASSSASSHPDINRSQATPKPTPTPTTTGSSTTVAGGIWTKAFCGVQTRVIGQSSILNAAHIEQLESALPETHQCYDWRLLYRLTRDGASLHTLLLQANASTSFSGGGQGKYQSSLLVVKDAKGAVFGGFLTEPLKGLNGGGSGQAMGSMNATTTGSSLLPHHPTTTHVSSSSSSSSSSNIHGLTHGSHDKYYGNGTVAVWSFVSSTLAFYPATNNNPYYVLSSPDCLAMGGGRNFALFVDSDLLTGSSGPCDTFDSPCLASGDQFTCADLELFVFESPLLS